jgi:hypothetical protein
MLYDGQYNSPGAPGGPAGVTVGARPVVNQQDIENFRKRNPGRDLQPRPGLPPTGPFTTVMGPPGAIGNEGGMIAHHMNPNVDAQGNVTAEGLSNARERQYEETGQPLGTGWGEPVNPNLNQSSNTQNAKPITARPMSSTAFDIGNPGGMSAITAGPYKGGPTDVTTGPFIPGGNQEVAQLADGRINALNIGDWGSGKVQDAIQAADEGNYQGTGKEGLSDRLLKRRSTYQDLINQM